MVEMTIDSIRVSITNYQRVIILREKNAERLLPIWIGPAEADSIAVKLQDVSVPRPLTHDLLENVISNLGAKIDHINVSKLSDDTFYANIILNVAGRMIDIDSRPSDAIALAVRAKVPIFVDDSVLDKAAVLIDKKTGGGIVPENPGQEKKEVTDEEMRRLSAFQDFINDLDLEDFDKT